jgi:Ca2+-binding RTX toxin-like protein
MATVNGTLGNDFVHRAGDGLVAPLGYNDVTGVTTGDDTMNGGNGNDTLNGGNDNDLLTGGNGADVLNGDNGSDALNGGEGDDALSGGNGTDVLNGGLGNDVLSGGNGPANIFVFEPFFGQDIVTDFTPGADIIQIDSSLFADAAAVLGAAQDDGVGNVAITYDSANAITLLGVTSSELGAGDFQLVA